MKAAQQTGRMEGSDDDSSSASSPQQPPVSMSRAVGRDIPLLKFGATGAQAQPRQVTVHLSALDTLMLLCSTSSLLGSAMPPLKHMPQL